MLKYVENITREGVKILPTTLFVFGDNLSRNGLGGQAKEMRDEPNAVGIPTKKLPSMVEKAFFTNTDEDFRLWAKESQHDIARLIKHALLDGDIQWPLSGIGTGRAQLRSRAPKIYGSIIRLQDFLGTL